jgi:DNA topoisomerase-1
MSDSISFEQVSSSIDELYSDAQRCAAAAGLVYVSADEPGIRRRRYGKGFGYHDPTNRPLSDVAVKARILQMAIPPAWKNVWICPDEDGHILAIGEDDRGRKQYIYHDKWRQLRDLLNFYRLIAFAEHLPPVRAHLVSQLRRRTLDREQVLATMVRIIDATAIRIGSEVYAEENDSYGLSTLTKKHVHINHGTVRLHFPAKSHQQADITLHDPGVARVLTKLEQHRRRRVFTVNGATVDAAEVNELLAHLAGQHVTAKDFRTWRGTLTAFRYLAAHLDGRADQERVMLGALDATAEVLGNTRAVARAHYVHPHLLSTFAEGTFSDYLARSVPRRQQRLDGDERALLAFLKLLLEEEFNRPRALAS